MTIEAALFYGAALLAIASALAMITAKNVVHSVLFMVLNFGVTGVVYLLLHAPFIAVVQVVVYAGAIMVLFLFVVMLLDQHDLSLDEPLSGQRPIGLVAVIALGAALLFGLATTSGVRPNSSELPGQAGAASSLSDSPADGAAASITADFGSPGEIGAELFSRQVLPFELLSFLLLAAMLGAVVISRFGRHGDARSPGGGEGAP